jgi:hypothetical protein
VLRTLHPCLKEGAKRVEPPASRRELKPRPVLSPSKFFAEGSGALRVP